MSRLIALTDDKKRGRPGRARGRRARARTYTQVGPGGKAVRLERLVKTTEQSALPGVAARPWHLHGDLAVLIAGDPEIDLIQVGRRLRNAARVYVRGRTAAYSMLPARQVVFGPDGLEKSRW